MQPYGMDLTALRLRDYDYCHMDRHERSCIRWRKLDAAEARRLRKRERQKARREIEEWSDADPGT